MGRAVFRATTRSRGVAQRFRAADARLDRFLRDELEDDMAPEAEEVLRDHAPELSGRLGDGIEARPYSGGRIGFEVTATAVSERGFDYVQVTRKGHRKAWIYPKVATRIEFVSGYGYGKVITRRVRGHKPDSDWVEDSMPQLRGLANEHARSLARTIDTRLL